MSHVQESLAIEASKEKVFDAYVGQINQWWPRLGTYRYSFAQEPRRPQTIQFEPRLNGRFYETFDDGSEYEIGWIIEWNPPDQLAYTWRDPRWPFHTTVTVTFIEIDDVTTVTVHHAGFGKNGVPEVGEGYGTGLIEILSACAQWVLSNRKSG
ncbi:MAG: SRPBCC domain-containing protein [Chloroflexota bacterium]